MDRQTLTHWTTEDWFTCRPMMLLLNYRFLAVVCLRASVLTLRILTFFLMSDNIYMYLFFMWWIFSTFCRWATDSARFTTLSILVYPSAVILIHSNNEFSKLCKSLPASFLHFKWLSTTKLLSLEFIFVMICITCCYVEHWMTVFLETMIRFKLPMDLFLHFCCF